MTNVLTFAPRKRATVAHPSPIPDPAATRAEIEEALHDAFDLLHRVVEALDALDGSPDEEDGGDAEPSLGAPEGHVAQLPWLRGTTRDLEIDRQPETRP